MLIMWFLKNMQGYAGEESMYVSQAILNSAYADSGLALDFYKSCLFDLT